MERTMSIIKPDGVERALIGKIIEKYESAGLRVIDLAYINITLEMAERHYYEHRGKGFYPGLIEYITSGPSVLVEMEGENGIATLRRVNDEIRSLWGVDTTRNTVHGSDSVKSAEREVELFFGNRVQDISRHHNADF